MTHCGHKPGRNPAAQQSPAVPVCYPFGRKHGRHRAVKRREFITLLGGAAAWPLAARAQQAGEMRRIGVLTPLAADDPERRPASRLSCKGCSNWAGRRPQFADRVPLAAGNPDTHSQIRRRISRAGAGRHIGTGSATVGPLLQLTRTVPIVFAQVLDPVGAGFVDSLSRPGGNATGFTALNMASA